jgi:hypothetical protein
MKTFSRYLKAALSLGSVALLILLSSPGAWANNNQGSDLVAPYGHFAFSGFGAPGPWSTVYLISEVSGVARTVNVKCYNDGAARVGPAAGTTVALAAFDMDFFTPEALGITTDPAFTGFGWCYFAVGAGDTVFDHAAVGVGTGIRGAAGTIFGSNASRAVAMDTAQHMVTTGSGVIPFWTKQGSWNSYILALNPTTTSRSLTVNVYNDTGTLQGTWTGIGALGARDLDFASLPDAVGATASFGNADVDVSGRGFVGWMAGFNFTSGELFLYAVPLSRNWTSELVAGDRP